MQYSAIKAEDAYRNKKINIAKFGMLLAWVSAVTAILMEVFNSSAETLISKDMTGMNSVLRTAIIAITILGVNDIICSIFCFIYNAMHGKSVLMIGKGIVNPTVLVEKIFDYSEFKDAMVAAMRPDTYKVMMKFGDI